MSVEISKDLAKLAGGLLVASAMWTGALSLPLGLGILLLGGVVTVK